VLGPAGIAVADADFDVGVALSFQPLYCPLGELVDDFDALSPKRGRETLTNRFSEIQ
jgi:hypothetical protein